MSQRQPINILKMFKNFFGCKIVVAANQRYPGNIQRLFRLQICLSRKSSKSWKYSKIFSPATLSQPQIIDILEISKEFFWPANLSQQQPINILETFKNFFACKIVVAANQRYPGNSQRFFRLQKCLSRKPSASWKYSKTFSAAKMSQQQPIKILKIFKGSFACKIVLAAKHLYPGKIQRRFRLQIVLAANHRYPGKIQRLFRLQKFLSSNPSLF